MSYDLMVFNKEAAPKTRTEFMAWYSAQTEWTDEHTYDDLSITTPELRSWFMGMVQTFPDMNGPDVTDEHASDYETDYSIGPTVIYAGFSWSLAKEAYEKAHRLARKHQVGLYDPSFEGFVLLPENGELRPMADVEKHTPVLKNPWWKFW